MKLQIYVQISFFSGVVPPSTPHLTTLQTTAISGFLYKESPAKSHAPQIMRFSTSSLIVNLVVWMVDLD